MEINIFGFDIENFEIVAILTLLGWVVTYFLISYWSKKVPDFNFLVYGIITAVLTPIAAIGILSWVKSRD